jgi:hypothetical protein
MAKVIVERPRHGSRSPSRKKGYRKYMQSMSVEELPYLEPMLGRWKGREKWLNEHLGPMRRFLRSNIGRPWNKIHQDLCEHVSFDNAVQGHVLVHIFEFVHLHVEVLDSATVYSTGGGRRRKLEARSMYVCPRTGILKAVQVDHHCHRQTRFPKSEDIQCLYRENCWWEVRVRSIEDKPGDRWDVWLERKLSQLTDQELVACYGDRLFATSKRPLTRGETRLLDREIRQSKSK